MEKGEKLDIKFFKFLRANEEERKLYLSNYRKGLDLMKKNNLLHTDLSTVNTVKKKTEEQEYVFIDFEFAFYLGP